MKEMNKELDMDKKEVRLEPIITEALTAAVAKLLSRSIILTAQLKAMPIEELTNDEIEFMKSVDNVGLAIALAKERTGL